MKYIAYAISTLAVSLIVPLVLKIIPKNSTNNGKSGCILTYSRSLRVLGIVSTLVIVLAFSLAFTQGIEDGEFYSNIPLLVFFVISAPLMVSTGLWLMLQSLNWRLVMEECISYRNLFGVVTRYEYHQITRICKCKNSRTGTVEKYKLYFGKRKIVIEGLVIGFDNFERVIKKQLRRKKISVAIEEI